MVDQRVAAEKQNGVGTPYIPPMTRRLKCRIDPEQSPDTVAVAVGALPPTSKSWSATARRLSASLSAFNEFVVEALGVEGDDVIHASNGKEALHGASGRPPTCWSPTSNSPEIDGWQIAERYREHDP